MNHVDTIVFDGSHAAHRISAASEVLTNKAGEQVEVVFGLLRLVSAVMRDNPAFKCYIVWDGVGSKGIRRALDPGYKNRPHDPETHQRMTLMHEQINRFWELFGQHLPIRWLVSDKYEADDIIAMLAHSYAASKKSTLIVSGDNDLLQLVSPLTTVYSPLRKGEKYCAGDNFAKYTHNDKAGFGFPDGQAHLSGKCLTGDSSDTIPGVGGVAELTALRVLAQHEWSLITLKQNPSADLVNSKVGKTILSPSGWQRIALNYKLMSLQGPIHKKLSKDNLEVRVGRFSDREFRTNLARMQFASILANFTQFIMPFKGLLEA